MKPKMTVGSPAVSTSSYKPRRRLEKDYEDESGILHHSEDNEEHPTHRPRRLVVFVGPHKAASTSLQRFFSSKLCHRDNDNPEAPAALKDWVWPYSSGCGGGKTLANLFIGNSQDRRETIDDIEHAWKTTNRNLILGSEEFDRVGSTPYTNRKALDVMQNIVDRLHVLNSNPLLQVDIVVNYRAPRVDHWISAWKQLSHKVWIRSSKKEQENTKPDTYKEWICKPDTAIWEYLHNAIDPLFVTQKYLDFLQNNDLPGRVYLVDMEGVAEQKLDISHVSACSVLGSSCQDGWVTGILPSSNQILNSKVADPGITLTQQNDIEWMLKQRDCAYAAKLLPRLVAEQQQNNHSQAQGAKRLEILYRHSLWDNCHLATDDLPPTQGQLDWLDTFRNTTFLLNLLQTQMSCNATSTGHEMLLPRTVAELKAERESLFAGGDGNVQPGMARDSETPFTKPTLQPNMEGTVLLPMTWMALAVMLNQLRRTLSFRR